VVELHQGFRHLRVLLFLLCQLLLSLLLLAADGSALLGQGVQRFVSQFLEAIFVTPREVSFVFFGPFLLAICITGGRGIDYDILDLHWVTELARFFSQSLLGVLGGLVLNHGRLERDGVAGFVLIRRLPRFTSS